MAEIQREARREHELQQAARMARYTASSFVESGLVPYEYPYLDEPVREQFPPSKPGSFSKDPPLRKIWVTGEINDTS